jgi:hypothetical protein
MKLLLRSTSHFIITWDVCFEIQMIRISYLHSGNHCYNGKEYCALANALMKDRPLFSFLIHVHAVHLTSNIKSIQSADLRKLF